MLKNQQPPPGQPSNARKGWLLFAAVLAVTLALDLCTKQWAWEHLRSGQPYVIWEGVLELAFAYNRGTSFSLVRVVEHPIVFLPITALIVAWLLVMVRSLAVGKLRFVGLGFAVGGALGNLYDRLFRVDAIGHHGVVDFIVIRYPWGGSWPSFNVADVALVLGTLALLWCLRRSNAGPA